MSEQITEQETTFQQAYIAAWNAAKNPAFDSENPGFKRNGKPSKYASLAACMKEVRAACEPHGLMYSQRLMRNGDEFTMRSFVTGHGEVAEVSEFPVTVPPNPQDFGKCLTYTKRQQVQADWGIVGEEDDDGNAAAELAASPSQPRKSQNRPSAQQSAKPASDGNGDGEKKRELWHQIGELKARAIELGIKEEGITSWISTAYKNKDMKEFNLTEVLGVKGYLSTLIMDKESLQAEQTDGESNG